MRADRQTGGKGRQGRVWLSPPGNLYASTVVRLRSDDPPPPTLAFVAAVALHEVVVAYVPTVQIKWPNDLLASSPAKERWGKLAGILLEREGDAVIAGFGVNLAHYPEGLTQEATSLSALAAELPTPGAFLGRLAEAFEMRLDQWRRDGLVAIRAAWLAAAHPPGTPLVTSDCRGTFDGLDESGALRLRLADGAVRVIHAGDVFLI